MLKAEDKLLIYELLSRCAYGYDERDLDLLVSCFASDAMMTLRVAGGDVIGPFQGRTALGEMFKNAMDSQHDVRRHIISNIFFKEDGEAPVVCSNLTLVATEQDNIALITAGIYTDRVELCDDGWVIKNRHLDLDRPH